MSRYAALTSHLLHATGERIPMTFEEIEAVVGRTLPQSALKHRAWWSNNPSNSVITQAWLDAGFRSEQVDMEGHRLVFRRVAAPGPQPAAAPPPGSDPLDLLRALYGALAGTVTIGPDTDLTAPTADTWRAER